MSAYEGEAAVNSEAVSRHKVCSFTNAKFRPSGAEDRFGTCNGACEAILLASRRRSRGIGS
jgi:hypothetical protein